MPLGITLRTARRSPPRFVLPPVGQDGILRRVVNPPSSSRRCCSVGQSRPAIVFCGLLRRAAARGISLIFGSKLSPNGTTALTSTGNADISFPNSATNSLCPSTRRSARSAATTRNARQFRQAILRAAFRNPAQNMRILESHEEQHAHRFSIPCSGCHTRRDFSRASAGEEGSLSRHGSPRSVFDARREV